MTTARRDGNLISLEREFHTLPRRLALGYTHPLKLEAPGEGLPLNILRLGRTMFSEHQVLDEVVRVCPLL